MSAPRVIKGHYTGVGSRTAPEDVLEIMFSLGRYLCDQGWRLRSGHADGSDDAFESGALSSPVIQDVGQEIYLPWNGFNKGYTGGYLIDPTRLANYEEARQIASTIHAVWDKLSKGQQLFHTRNVYQVLGLDLRSPSRYLVCYAKPIGNKSQFKGGTNTAIQLALRHGVPVFNLYYEEHRERILKAVA